MGIMFIKDYFLIKIRLRIERIIVAKKRVQRVNILPKIKKSTLQTIAIFRKMENNPKVNIFKGKVRMSNIGFTA